MTYELLTRAVREDLTNGNRASVEDFLRSEHPADLAAFIAELEADEAWRLLDMMAVERQAEVFGYFDPEYQVELAEHTSRTKLARLVTEMPSDERADLYNKLTDDQQAALLPALAQAEREDLRRLASYPEGTAGSIMTSDYAVLTADLTARQALDKLRREAPDKETIYRAYVVDADRHLVGSVRLADLILAAPSKLIDKIMEQNTLAVRVDDDQESVARRIADYDVLAVPVIDQHDRLIGIVTHDDALDVLQQEATEDFHKIGAAGNLVGNVRDASVGLLYRKRVMWLVLLVFANIFTGAGISFFEDTIAAYVALVFFLPLLIGSAGNAGAQAATLMVRALATGEIVMRDWGRMIGRELLVAVSLGATMAAAVALIGAFRGGPEIAVVVALTMVLVVMAGSLIGMSLPFLLNRLKLDPATASAPLVTFIADAVGVVIYFWIATAILIPSA